MEAIQLRNVSFTYPGQQRKALDDVSLTVGQGEFWVLCGLSGCGKSTLLRQLKMVLAPHGTRSGEVLIQGHPLETLDQRTQSQIIGFVSQSPESQIVTDQVWHELAFGLESLGLETPVIRRRVAEMASFFGIQDWFRKSTAELSGGQKQLLNLAAVMVMQPDILLLDEPTAQLDPIAASDFLSAVGKLNRELGTTVLLTEHRLEDAFAMADYAAVMDGGGLLCRGTPRQVGGELRKTGHAMFLSMPAAMQVWAETDGTGDCPLTVREGRDWLERFAEGRMLAELPPEPERPEGEPVIAAKDLCYRYTPDAPYTVKGLSFSVKPGEFLALLGGNGTGKTTTLKLLAGSLRPERGSIRVSGSVALLPQDPRTLFVKKTVWADLADGLDGPDSDGSIDRVVRLCRLEELVDRHPYDLSGGEQQRAALAKVLLRRPDILLLDEPTKGLDARFKESLARILGSLLDRGVSILMVSHDVEFCARHAHRCALFFDGGIVAEETPRSFFSGNRFYTTSANRMARQLLPEAVTPEDIIIAFGHAPAAPAPQQAPPERPKDCGTAEAPRQSRPVPRPRRLPKRTLTAALAVLLLIPLTLYAGMTLFDNRKYDFIALLILLECMAPFFLTFEGRKPQARELVIIAALCAIGVAGRAALFMLPQFKPVMALTIIAGAAFGGETGFLVGAMTMLTSNVLFSQGPWTPWQMFAMGLTGFLAGILFRPGALRQGRGVLALFGGLCAILVYGGIMNLASYLMWAESFNGRILLSYYVTGFHMDCVHAAATAFFLWLAAEPMLEKLERIKVKYGILEFPDFAAPEAEGDLQNPTET